MVPDPETSDEDLPAAPGDGEPIALISRRGHPETRFTPQLVSALLAVYIFWGSTYLAISRAIVTLPPFILASIRFFIAGSLVIGWQVVVRHEKINSKAILPSGLIALLLLLGGNGGVVWSEKYLASGIAALLVGAAPFWFVLLDWWWLKSPRPTLPVCFALIVGFVGLALLVYPTVHSSGSSHELAGAIAVMIAAISWSAGSIYSKHARVPGSPVMLSGLQMLWGGVILGAASFVSGETRGFHFASVTAESWFCLAYLVVLGSLVGYTCYTYVLHHAAPAVTSTYAYVNPVVAVFLGWAVNSEPITSNTLIAAALIIAAVIMISLKKK